MRGIKRFKRQSLEKKGEPFSNKIMKALFFACLILLVWEIYLFRETIIDVRILLVMFFIPGVILTPFMLSRVNEWAGTDGHWTLHYLLHTVVAGGLLIFSFMALNYYGADTSARTETFQIRTKGSLPGSKRERHKRKLYAMIDCHGLEKQILFSHGFESEMQRAKNVVLVTRDGLFGYKILEDYYLE